MRHPTHLNRTFLKTVAGNRQTSAIVVQRLPKTRSGKVLRATIRKIADGQDYSVPSTIDDPAVLKEFEAHVKAIGYGRK